VQQQQLSVYAARLGLLRVQSEQLSQRVNLHLVLGGGWMEADIQTASTDQSESKEQETQSR
jgi:outer membrane protein TolC